MNHQHRLDFAFNDFPSRPVPSINRNGLMLEFSRSDILLKSQQHIHKSTNFRQLLFLLIFFKFFKNNWLVIIKSDEHRWLLGQEWPRSDEELGFPAPLYDTYSRPRGRLLLWLSDNKRGDQRSKPPSSCDIWRRAAAYMEPTQHFHQQFSYFHWFA